MFMLKNLISGAVMCCGIAFTFSAIAQAYPTKPVRVLVPFVAAGGVDLVARALSDRLSDRLRQQFVVDNRPGAGGRIAMETLAQAAADGHTLAMISGTTAASSNLHAKLSYDFARDFAAITQVTEQPYIVLLNTAVSAKSVPELITLAKSKPGVLNYGSSGTGGMQHLAGTLLTQLTGTRMIHVPYKGGGQAVGALISGEIQLGFLNPLGARPHIAAGRVRAIAVTSKKRSPAFPQLPAVAETVPGFEVNNWYGLIAPAKTPVTVIQFIHREIGEILKEEAVRARLEKEGSDVVWSAPQVFRNYILEEVKLWGKVIREAGIQAN
jgi:tripartite-type tricarboxylate transporter receptor subunit TctC